MVKSESICAILPMTKGKGVKLFTGLYGSLLACSGIANARLDIIV